MLFLLMAGLPFLEDDNKESSDDKGSDDKEANDTSDDSEDTDTEDDTNEEEEAAEDDSEEAAEDSGDDEEEDTDDAGSDDLLRQYARDPKSVKPELRGAVKKLLGSYTRKMQAASRVLEHATAFQQLIQDPGFKKWVKQRQTELSGKKGRNNEDDDEDSGDSDSKLTRDSIREEIRAALSERNADEESQKEFSQFKKDNPDWKVYRFDMHDLMGKHPTLSFQDAYDWITKGSKTSSKRNKLKRDKKEANLEKPNRTGARGVVGKPKGKMTIRRAMEIAAKKLGVSMED